MKLKKIIINNNQIHSEADEFGFVKVFGYLARLDGVNGADGD